MVDSESEGLIRNKLERETYADLNEETNNTPVGTEMLQTRELLDNYKQAMVRSLEEDIDRNEKLEARVAFLSAEDFRKILKEEDSNIPDYSGMDPNDAIISYAKYIRSLKKKSWYYPHETHLRDQQSIAQYSSLHRNIFAKAQIKMPAEATGRINILMKSAATRCHIDFLTHCAEILITAIVKIPLSKAQIPLGPDRERGETLSSIHKRVMEYLSEQYTVKNKPLVEHAEYTKLDHESLVSLCAESGSIIAMLYAKVMLRAHLKHYRDRVYNNQLLLAEALCNNNRGPVSIAEVSFKLEKLLGSIGTPRKAFGAARKNSRKRNLRQRSTRTPKGTKHG